MQAEIAGTVIHFEQTGEGEKRVVLLHGWGCSGALMKSAAEALSPCMRVLTVDFPGFGESGRPPEPWGVPEYSEALRALLIRLDFLPCAAVAHSFGGRVALWLAAHDPEMFDKLVITGGAGLKKPQTEEARQRSAEFQRKKKTLQTVKKIPLLRGAAERAEEKLRLKYGSADYNALDAEMRKTFVKVISLDLTDCLEQVKQPTLLVWGDRDTETPLWMGQKMERTIPDAGLVVLEGGSHFAYLEQAPRFNAIVKTFLTGA